MNRTQNTETSRDETDCVACTHAAEHGWYGVDGEGENHCGDCHRYWNSHREGHCASCCRHFASNAAFDAHRYGDACFDPVGLSRQDGRPRFASRSTRLGVTWSLVHYRELPDFDALG